MFQVVASVLLTAAIAFGNCSMCFTPSNAESSGKHACCKRKKVQPACHQPSDPEPAQHEEGCAGQFSSLETVQATERISAIPVLVAVSAVEPFSAEQASPGERLSGIVARVPLALSPSFLVPLRI